jgi:hypothetical protein
LGNALLINYRPSKIEIKTENFELALGGFLINPIGELYIQNLGFIEIDFCKYIKKYEKNVFFKVIEEIKERAIKKTLELCRMYT